MNGDGAGVTVVGEVPDVIEQLLAGKDLARAARQKVEKVELLCRYVDWLTIAFHRAGLPVDAVGVGVEPLTSDGGRALFAEAFAPIRSWTVRLSLPRRPRARRFGTARHCPL